MTTRSYWPAWWRQSRTHWTPQRRSAWTDVVAAAAAVSGIRIGIDWDKDGDFDGTGEDVTSRVRRTNQITLSYGRDMNGPFAPIVAGRGSFTLNNDSRDYTSRNTSSPLYGFIKPARPVLITRTYPAYGSSGYPATYTATYEGGEASTYTLFAGHTDDQPLNPDVDAKTVQMSLVDWLADLRGQKISTALHQSIRSGEAVDLILDHCGWTGGRDIDNGASIFPYWWEDGTDALDALEKVVRSEGPPAIITIGVEGEFIFRDRHHRLGNEASNTSQDTWTNSDLGKPFILDEGWRSIINTGQIAVDQRTMHTPEHVWTSEGLITLQAGETRDFTVTASDPFVNAAEPVENRDYVLYGAGSATFALNRTSGQSVTLSITAVGSVIYIRDLKLQAQPIRVAYTRQVVASDAASIEDYGARSFPNDLVWSSYRDTEAILGLALDMHAQPLPVVTTRFVVAGQRGLGERILSRNLSDRVLIQEDESMLDSEFYLESITHTLMGEHDHAVQFELEAVPDSEPDYSTLLILDSTEPGHGWDEGVLLP